MTKQSVRYFGGTKALCLAIAMFTLLLFALSACGAQTVNVNIKETTGKPDKYFFDQTSVTLNKGDSLNVTNNSDELQDIDAGDAAKAGVDKAIPVNQSGTLTFNTAGTFTIKSEKGATITVTVQ